MSQLTLADGAATAERLQVKYQGDTVTVSLAGITLTGTDPEVDALVAAFVVKRAEARTHRDVLATMLPTKAEK